MDRPTTSLTETRVTSSRTGAAEHVAHPTNPIDGNQSTRTYQDINIDGGNSHFGDQYIHNVTQNFTTTHTDVREAVLKSLRYDQMNARFNMIKEVHSQTFRWLFDQGNEIPHSSKYDERKRLQTIFAKWLLSESTSDMFLVEGKPGSGKSAIMKYIVEEWKETSLSTHSGGHTTRHIVLSHFFWVAGAHPIQHNLKGLLLSLAYQAIQMTQDYHLPAITKGKFEPHDWSERELCNLLLDICSSLHQNCFIFIDAVDEHVAENRPQELANLLKLLNNQSHVKLCVSSRPAAWLSKLTSSMDQIRLQDLTARDIQILAEKEIEKHFSFYETELQHMKAEITKTICEKADGVFLWVVYTLQALEAGLDDYDDEETLLQRLEKLPSAMSDLYRRMLVGKGADKDFNLAESMRYLAVGSLIGKVEMNLLTYKVMVEDQTAARYMDSTDPSGDATFVSELRKIEAKITRRTAGLLVVDTCPCMALETIESLREFHWTGEHSDHCAIRYVEGYRYVREITEVHSLSLAYRRVGFVHRTAKDFLDELQLNNQRVLQPEIVTKIKQGAVIAQLAFWIEGLLPVDGTYRSPEWSIYFERHPTDVEFFLRCDRIRRRIIETPLKSPSLHRLSLEVQLVLDYYKRVKVDRHCILDTPGLAAFTRCTSLPLWYVRQSDTSSFYKGYLLNCLLQRQRGANKGFSAGERAIIEAVLSDPEACSSYQGLFYSANKRSSFVLVVLPLVVIVGYCGPIFRAVFRAMFERLYHGERSIQVTCRHRIIMELPIKNEAHVIGMLYFSEHSMYRLDERILVSIDLQVFDQMDNIYNHGSEYNKVCRIGKLRDWDKASPEIIGIVPSRLEMPLLFQSNSGLHKEFLNTISQVRLGNKDQVEDDNESLATRQRFQALLQQVRREARIGTMEELFGGVYGVVDLETHDILEPQPQTRSFWDLVIPKNADRDVVRFEDWQFE